MSAPSTFQTLRLYKLLLRAPDHVMPTTTARKFMRKRVKEQFRAHREETNPRIIQFHHTLAFSVLQTAAENAVRDYVEEPMTEAEKLEAESLTAGEN